MGTFSLHKTSKGLWIGLFVLIALLSGYALLNFKSDLLSQEAGIQSLKHP